MTLAEFAKRETTRYIVNAAFNQAVLIFNDGSHLNFEHTSRENRWAKPSADATTAGEVCRSLSQFRLNAKHLQLFFIDSSDAEYTAPLS